jgi:hypothetical protein
MCTFQRTKIQDGYSGGKMSKLKKDDYCGWNLAEEDCDYWSTTCEEEFTLNEGTLKENRVRYCPFCGRKIKDITEVKK